ncbi:MAG: NADH-quinone oxidoreductase subunit N [Cycloclasticus sp.]|nr:MAG: NADH-quinone oxidoreductase subunit N [Cycloclasticus sp.]
MMNADYQSLLPLIVLSAGATILMLQIAFRRGIVLTATLTTFVLLLAACSVVPAASSIPRLVTPLLQADHIALLFCALFCVAAAVTTVLSIDYLGQRGDQPEEYFLLLVLSTLGACVLAYATHFASLLLGMELMSVALYALIAYPDKSVLPLEAAVKYLVLSGAASASILFGFALLYAATGTLEFVELGRQLGAIPSGDLMLLVASFMIISGIGFKLSLVPFHAWTPDVYDGAPAPITGFLASVSKAAIFIVLLRWFIEADLFRYSILIESITIIAVISMLVGNLLALLQKNIKRMLAYSSIAHMGYLLIILVVSSDSNYRALATEAGIYYLVAYTATTLAAFGLLTMISARHTVRENVQLDDVHGLFWHQPLLASLMLVSLLSLAGIPLTAGFIAKFYLFNVAITGYYWILLASLVIGSSIGIYYYLRVVFYMTRWGDEQQSTLSLVNRPLARIISCALIASILLLGIIPQPLMEYLKSIT